jgi:hypothetical protein
MQAAAVTRLGPNSAVLGALAAPPGRIENGATRAEASRRLLASASMELIHRIGLIVDVEKITGLGYRMLFGGFTDGIAQKVGKHIA